VQVDAAMRVLDTDGDGLLDYREFVKLLGDNSVAALQSDAESDATAAVRAWAAAGWWWHFCAPAHHN
jgi:hypothetical protein